LTPRAINEDIVVRVVKSYLYRNRLWRSTAVRVLGIEQIQPGGDSLRYTHEAKGKFRRYGRIRLRVEASRGSGTEHKGCLEQVVEYLERGDGERPFTDSQDPDAGNDDDTHAGAANKIYEDLIEGKVDLGVVAYPAKRSQIVSIPFRHDELVLAVPPDNALAKLNKVAVGQLQGQKFVGYERDIPTRKASDKILRDHGVKPNYALEFDNIETIKRAVEIGLGCAIVPRMTVENEVTRGTLKLLEFQEGTFLRPLAIIYKRGRELSPAVRKFIDTLTHSTIVPRARGDKSGDKPPEKSEGRSRGERAERAERNGDGVNDARLEKVEKTA
jgi:hypothetical protein